VLLPGVVKDARARSTTLTAGANLGNLNVYVVGTYTRESAAASDFECVHDDGAQQRRRRPTADTEPVGRTRTWLAPTSLTLLCNGMDDRAALMALETAVATAATASDHVVTSVQATVSSSTALSSTVRDQTRHLASVGAHST
jgi:hypothetical protein